MDKTLLSQLERMLNNTGDMALKRRAYVLISALDPKPKERIIDIGCGDGFFLKILSSLNLDTKLVGCDNDKNALVSARRNLEDKVLLKQANLEYGLPFPNNHFDKVVLSEVLEHIDNDKTGLQEVYRVLKPGGGIYVSVPNLNYPFFWDPVNWFLQRVFQTHIRSGFWAGIWNQHLRLYTKDGLGRLLEGVGFRVENLQPLTWWCLPFNYHLVNFTARLLYNGKLNKSLAADILKFNIRPRRRHLLITVAFSLVNIWDKLNDLFPRNEGVTLFARGLKVQRPKSNFTR